MTWCPPSTACRTNSRSESRCSSILTWQTRGYETDQSREGDGKREERKRVTKRSTSGKNIRPGGRRKTIQRQSRLGPGFLQWPWRWVGRLDDEDDLSRAGGLQTMHSGEPSLSRSCLHGLNGGSRLSSIGDIEVPREIVEPRILWTSSRGEEIVIEKDDKENTILSDEVECKTCTLENEPFQLFYCACNSPNPRRDKREKIVIKMKMLAELKTQICGSCSTRLSDTRVSRLCLILCALNMVSVISLLVGRFPVPMQSCQKNYPGIQPRPRQCPSARKWY